MSNSIVIRSDFISQRLQYTLNFIFNQVLELPYVLTTDANTFAHINYSSLPNDNSINILKTSPVLNDGYFSDLLPEIEKSPNNLSIFPINNENFFGQDIFSAVFYCISGWERYFSKYCDIHGRFLPINSAIFHDNFNFFGIVELEELLMNYSEKGKKKREKKELKKLKKKKPTKVAVLAATDRSGNILFKKLEDDRVQADHISNFLKSRISKDSVICGSNNKAFKTVNAEHIKHKEISSNKKMKGGIYSVSTVHKKITAFVGWIYYKFRGVATKYLTNYIMWFVIKGKYLANKIIEDTGRLLNLAASDRRAWERYSDLMSKTYLFYNI
jgi:hypothetical protein